MDALFLWHYSSSSDSIHSIDQYKGNRKSRFATSEPDYATLPKDVANTSGGWSLGGEEGAPPPD